MFIFKKPNINKVNAIIHIGVEKTGSTSIQNFLYANKEKLIQNKFYFTQKAGIKNNRAVSACCINPNADDSFFVRNNANNLRKREKLQKKYTKLIQNELANLPANTETIIISSEHLHSRLKATEEIERFRNILLPYCHTFKIICYIREQSACCNSAYSTHIRNGKTETLEKFATKCVPRNHKYNYHKSLSKWESVFGAGALEISLFDNKKFVNQNLLDDFTSKINPNLVGELIKPHKANESLNYTGQILSKSLSRAFSSVKLNDSRNKIRKKCQRIISKAMVGTGEQLPLSHQQNIYDSFIESNELVRKKWFPELETIFTRPEREKTPDYASDDELIETLANAFRILSKV